MRTPQKWSPPFPGNRQIPRPFTIGLGAMVVQRQEGALCLRGKVLGKCGGPGFRSCAVRHAVVGPMLWRACAFFNGESARSQRFQKSLMEEYA